MLCVALGLSMAACEPDPEPQPEPAKPTINLAGTSWQSDAENIYSYSYAGYAIDMYCSQVAIIDFIDGTNGELFAEVDIDVPEAPAASQHNTSTDAFTYTFDGTTLKLTSTSDGVEGSDGVLTFHPADTTFTMRVNDTGIREMLGIDTMVFHLIQGSVKSNK